jgi:protein-tyrosine phosphatase
MTVSNTQFGKATKCFEFFATLGPNTDVHWSQDKDEFVLTGGGWPGCATVANTIFLYKPEDTVEKLKKVATELFTLLSAAKNTPEQYDLIQNLRISFRSALTGVSFFDSFGGLHGLSDLYKGRGEIEIKQLLWQIDKKLNKTLGKLYLQLSDSKLNASDQGNFEIETAPESFDDENWEIYLSRESISIPPTYSKSFLYSITLIYNIVVNTIGKSQLTWWNDVSYDPQEIIYLGALPLIGTTRDDLSSLRELGIKAVLSVVESFEIESKGLLGSPVAAKQWEENEIKQLHISTQDFKPLSLDDVNLGVEFLRWNVKNNRPIYVHCKAGKARSALIVMCYLIKIHGLSFPQALNFIREKRPQMHLDEGKLDNAKQYELWCRQRETAVVVS